MYKVRQNDISLTRGDTMTLKLALKMDTGEEYKPKTDDTILFTVKKNVNDKAVIIQKTAVNGYIAVQPSETENLAYGNYCYDVELRSADGSVMTVITPHLFRICEEVTF